MVDNMEKKILIREFNEDTDFEVVGKLERKCEIGSKMGASIFSSMIADPLYRIRFYPLHVMLVAELLENGKLVGVIRGCIKGVATGSGKAHVKMGCILGLRVSPAHRRMRIGTELVNSVEDWLRKNGAEYTFVATEDNNTASLNLFTLKHNYVHLSSLVIFVQQICFPAKNLSQDVKIEKLPTDQAISFYKQRLRNKEVYPVDIDAILKETLSLGTWVCYFKEEGWVNSHTKDKKEDIGKTPTSWIMFSVWNACEEASKLQTRKSNPVSSFDATLTHAREKIFPCQRRPMNDSLQKPIGFLFLYGLLGEGEKVGELVKSLWCFASNVGQNVKDCKVIVAELGVTDPLIKHVPQESSMSRINDLWYAKKLIFHDNTDRFMLDKVPVGDVFVDPRDL